MDEGTNPDTFAVHLFRDSVAANQARWAQGGRASGPAGISGCIHVPQPGAAAWVPNTLPPYRTRSCSKGKVEAFRALREQTLAQLAAAFPQTVADYQALRAPPAAAAAAAGAAAATTAAAAAVPGGP